MQKKHFLLRAAPLISACALFCGALQATNSIAPGLNPESLQISAGRDFDALANKRIYRSIKVKKNESSERFDVKFVADAASSNLRVSTIGNTCKTEDDKALECDVTLEIVGAAGDFSGVLKFENISDQAERASMKIAGSLVEKALVGPQRKSLESYDRYSTIVSYASADLLLNCKDLFHVDKDAQNQCEIFHDAVMGYDISSVQPHACRNEADPNERAKCEGLVQGIQLNSCEKMTGIAKTFCEIVPKAATKHCDANDRDCQAIQGMIHGYVNCMSSGVGDFLPLCVAQQSAYLDGISGSWLKKLLALTPPTTVDAKEVDANALTLAYIPEKRIARLNLSESELKALFNAYPSLMRSALLNAPNSKSMYASQEEIWAEIDQHLHPEQTVGYELECPAVKLDITEGTHPDKVASWLQKRNAFLSFEDLLTDEERKNKKLNLDVRYEKEHAAWYSDLTATGFWTADKEWPYFDSYGRSLFQTEESFMNFPLLNVTLESRYSYKQFPHVELVSAPLTKLAKPLNHSNIMNYMANVIADSCNKNDDWSLKSTKLEDWKNLADNTAITPNGEKLKFEMTAGPIFEKTPMTCDRKTDGCHVQSNVGVYLDQLFTDAFLMQTIGYDWASYSDETYHAAWTVAKKTFSVLQWDQERDRVIDPRNHAAGIFTYTVYDLFLRSILYTGKFDFWKGTITQLMKYELRKIWKMLDTAPEGERELFQRAALALYEAKELPKELKDVIQPVMQSFIKTKYYGIGPSLPGGETPYYNEDFAQRVQNAFKEMLWTVALADDAVYYRASSTQWGYIVSEDTKLDYKDANGVQQTRRGFIQGCAYGTHRGAQCDLSKTIKPVKTTVKYGEQELERIYGIVETRYGNAEFNQAIFWRCHDSNRSTVLGHVCTD